MYSYYIIEENEFRLMNSLGILLIIYFWFIINNSKNKNSVTNVSGIISFFFSKLPKILVKIRNEFK